jgi:hypothetical protein
MIPSVVELLVLSSVASSGCPISDNVPNPDSVMEETCLSTVEWHSSGPFARGGGVYWSEFCFQCRSIHQCVI